jgi:hypothetical protein
MVEYWPRSPGMLPIERLESHMLDNGWDDGFREKAFEHVKLIEDNYKDWSDGQLRREREFVVAIWQFYWERYGWSWDTVSPRMTGLLKRMNVLKIVLADELTARRAKRRAQK